MESLLLHIGLFLTAAVVIAIIGSYMSAIADRLAAQTGMGEALIGVLFLGGSTSLSGLVTSVTSAAANHPQLAISNALGGIAAQTVFLAIADLTYPKANLEHAAAEVTILTQVTLLITMLAMPLLAMAGPNLSVFGIHPVSVILIAVYVFGLRLVSSAQMTPMWEPKLTAYTRIEQPDVDAKNLNSTRLWILLSVFAIVIAIAGYVVATAGVAIAFSTGISETAIGGLLTAICTSLPELVTSITAVRRGALTLAVSGIIGGNCFDVLFLAFSDFAYRPGSIYHAIAQQQIFIISLTILLSAILLLGLIRREQHGIANIGFESFLIVILYLLGFSLLFYIN